MRRTPYRASSAFGAILQYRFPLASAPAIIAPGPLEVISWELVTIGGISYIQGAVNRPGYIGMDYGLVKGAANYTNSTFVYTPEATRAKPILKLCDTDFLLRLPDPLFGAGTGGGGLRVFASPSFSRFSFDQLLTPLTGIYFGTIFGSLSATDDGDYIDSERAFQLT